MPYIRTLNEPGTGAGRPRPGEWLRALRALGYQPPARRSATSVSRAISFEPLRAIASGGQVETLHHAERQGQAADPKPIELEGRVLRPPAPQQQIAAGVQRRTG